MLRMEKEPVDLWNLVDDNLAFPKDREWWKHEVLSEDEPRVLYYPEFLSSDEADFLILLAKDRMKASKVTSNNGSINTKVRSSTIHMLDEADGLSPVVRAIKRRVQKETKISKDHYEGPQIQHYQEPRGDRKDFYSVHFDSIMGKERRIATFLFFLADAEGDGSETVFPMVYKGTKARHGRLGETSEMTIVNESILLLDREDSYLKERYWKICENPEKSDFLSVKPKKGAAILFYTLTPGGHHDRFSAHGGCPVRLGQGSKWISQLWIRENIYSPESSRFLLSWWKLHYTHPRKYYFKDMVSGLKLNSKQNGGGIEACTTASDGTAKGNELSGGDIISWPGRNLRDSGSSTFLFSISVSQGVCRAQSEGRNVPETVITLKSHNDGPCCTYKISIRGCIVTVHGPSRGQEKLLSQVVLLDNQENKVVWIIEPEMGKFGPEKLPFTEWKYRSFLLLNGESDMKSEDRHKSFVTNIEKVNWDNMQMCITGSHAKTLSHLFFFKQAMPMSVIERTFLSISLT
eukprot:g862.t1